MKTLTIPQLIVSSFTNTSTYAQNLEDFETLKVWLNSLSIPFKELIGRYKGTDEHSLLISSEHRRVVDAIVRDYNQESYLELYHDGFAELVYRNGSREKLGYLKQVTPEHAKTLDAFSFDPIENQYYTVVRQ